MQLQILTKHVTYFKKKKECKRIREYCVDDESKYMKDRVKDAANKQHV